MIPNPRAIAILGVLPALLSVVCLVHAQSPKNSATEPGGAAYKKIFEGYKKVVSTTDGKPSLYEIWVDKKNHRMLAELPKDYARKKFFVALTVSSGERFAGLQVGDMYVYWKKIGDRLALIEPNVATRSSGDNESKGSVKRLFTDRVIVDLPILATSTRGEPVINMADLLVKYGSKFFGAGLSANPTTYRLKQIKEAKAFPENVELAFEVPVAGGRLKTFHYSISSIPDSTGYKPRVADDRVGYFTTAYDDLGKYKEGATRVRYINRWHLEKADPKLKLSPPKKPIVFYVEHSTPIRYRRFVRDGTLYWNKAFEQVGLVNAIEVYFQDATTGAHMDKDPEDVRYNFIRWLNNDISTAIGPSRVHPLTGQILDADIVLTDGWIRVFERDFSQILPKLAMQGFSPETLAWLERHPRWDPRYLLAAPQERNMFLARRAQRGILPQGGHPLANVRTKLMGDDEFDGISGRNSQINGACMAAWGKGFDLTLLRMSLDLIGQKDDGKNDTEDNLDGIPARFIGPLLADLVAHEVGHTLGLRHNFKASSVYTLKEINSKKMKGKMPFTSSVMDYNPLNINMKDGEIQGDYCMIDIGPYDRWAIEYGYTFDAKGLDKILSRCTERELQYGTDQDTLGPDPFARRYDFSSNPLDYAKSQMKLAKYHRQRLIDKFVKKGDSWAKARKGYGLTLRMQTRSLSMMANWIGGAYVNRDHKGDKGNRDPIDPVTAKWQRNALKWVLDNAFRDDSFGLTPQILRKLRTDFLASDESFSRLQDPAYPIHDRIMGIQSSVLTMLMNPTTLRRVYDNELALESDKDALTLPELLETVEKEVWSELNLKPNGKYNNRKPMISSLRRNLQREYVERLIDLIHPDSGNPAASRPISTLAMLHLREVNGRIGKMLQGMGKVDRYTEAHLRDAQTRITKALESRYVRNVGSGGGGVRFFFHAPAAARCAEPGCRHCNPAVRGGSWDSRR